MDETYSAHYTPHESESTDNDTYDRVAATLGRLLGAGARVREPRRRVDGLREDGGTQLEADEGALLVVAHGASCASVHEALIGRFMYIGLCTLSLLEKNADGRWKLSKHGDSSHLSDKSNLRPW